MSLKRVLFFACTVILIFAFTGESFAQVRGQRGPVRKAGMVLGLGWGNGNHWRNPGPNSDYYNPWTAHNSTYFTRGYGNPDFGSDNGNTFYAQPETPTWNPLPEEAIQSEVEPQPGATPINLPPSADSDNRPDVENPDVETPKPETDDSVSDWSMDNAEFDENKLLERPVKDEPKYNPKVVDDSVNKKIQDLKENNFWSEK